MPTVVSLLSLCLRAVVADVGKVWESFKCFVSPVRGVEFLMRTSFTKRSRKKKSRFRPYTELTHSHIHALGRTRSYKYLATHVQDLQETETTTAIFPDVWRVIVLGGVLMWARPDQENVKEWATRPERPLASTSFVIWADIQIYTVSQRNDPTTIIRHQNESEK